MKFIYFTIPLLILFSTLEAESVSVSFNDWKERFSEKAINEGISKNRLKHILKDLKLDPDVIALDTNQPEFTKPIWDYIDNATASSRVKKGKKLLKIYQQILAEIEIKYGVEKEIIVAIWAMESDFGANYGNKNVFRSLATLAHQGKRAEFAEQELLAALHIIQDHNINYKALVGSWAGAMGQPQFMPSSYLNYAVDYDKDGIRDLWKTPADVFASIANFLSESGWKENQGWGEEVFLSDEFDWHLNTVEHNLPFSKWQRFNLERAGGEQFQYQKQLARLFIPTGKNGPIFLVTHNFDVIRKYNKSNSYALAVAQLSRLLAGGTEIIADWPREDETLSYSQKEEIQVLLGIAGFDTGKIDGKIGENTQRAIYDWQTKQGLVADGYANKDFLELLKKDYDARETSPNNEDSN